MSNHIGFSKFLLPRREGARASGTSRWVDRSRGVRRGPRSCGAREGETSGWCANGHGTFHATYDGADKAFRSVAVWWVVWLDDFATRLIRMCASHNVLIQHCYGDVPDVPELLGSFRRDPAKLAERCTTSARLVHDPFCDSCTTPARFGTGLLHDSPTILRGVAARFSRNSVSVWHKDSLREV